MILAQSAMSGYSGLQRCANAGKFFENRFDFAPLPLWQLGVWYLHELFAVVWIPLSSNVTFNH